MRKLFMASFLLVLSACGSAPSKPDSAHSLDVARILRQVNDAIASSVDPNNKNFPPVTSVTLELQVSVASTVDASGKFPLDMLTAGGKVEHQKLHHIVLNFAPSAVRTPTSESPPKVDSSRLANAIRAVYSSVANNKEPYKFTNGSITLQCTLSTEADAGINILGLVPIQADASSSDDAVQTLVLNFGFDPTRVNSN
jgi:hypothetical protein